MKHGETRKVILEALLAEASRLGDAIAERHAAAERFISVAGALAGVAFTLGLGQRQWSILVGLPVGLAVIILYMIQIYTDAGMHSGHRKAIEIYLEKEFGQVVLVGQSRVAKSHSRRPSVVIAPLVIFLVWAGTWIFGWVALGELKNDVQSPNNGHSELWNDGYYGLYISLILGTLILIGQALRENAIAEKKAEAIARDAWPGNQERRSRYR
jgi:hypothetical protein